LVSEGNIMTTSTPDQRHLAALIDGEPGPGGFDVAIRALEDDDELRGRFERGLIIGQMLRGEPSMPAARAISDRVATALADEPVVMRPRRRSVPARSVNRPAAALALAASLVAVAILVGPGIVSGPTTGASVPGLAAVGDGAPSLGDGAQAPDPGLVAQWSIEQAGDSSDLDALLVDHRERASASGLTGFIPYAAVVGHSGLR
jgi:sigma-E factor negative regulatory protein RseA